MKSVVIGGQVYDVEKSLIAHSIGSEHRFRSRKSWRQMLFRTVDDRWFLVGVGGPESPFGILRDGKKHKGYRTEVLTKRQARAWLKKHLDDRQARYWFNALAVA